MLTGDDTYASLLLILWDNAAWSMPGWG